MLKEKHAGVLMLWWNSYAGGQSEVVMGLAIKKFGWKRNDIVVTTKVCIFLAHSHQEVS